MKHVEMSRDQEGPSPVPKDRGVKKKGAEKGWEETDDIHIHFLRLRSCPQGRRTARKAIFIS